MSKDNAGEAALALVYSSSLQVQLNRVEEANS
jgi:hypothetical protein